MKSINGSVEPNLERKKTMRMRILAARAFVLQRIKKLGFLSLSLFVAAEELSF